MLDSYRVIADYSKSSKYELNLKAGDLVDIVEKCPNGMFVFKHLADFMSELLMPHKYNSNFPQTD